MQSLYFLLVVYKMIFTNASGNMQPYRSWKGKSTRASIPANSRPFMNSVSGAGANEDACIETPILEAQPTTGSGGVRGPIQLNIGESNYILERLML